MKLPIFLFIAFISFSYSLSGQFNFYVSSGITLSNASQKVGEDAVTPETENISSPFISFGIRASMNDAFYFVGELGYFSQGYKNSRFIHLTELVTTTKYNYINILSGVGYTYKSFSVELGPFLGYNLSDRIKKNDGEWSENLNVSENFYVGFFSGLRLEIVDNVSIFSRYYFGLSNAIDALILTDFNGNPTSEISEKLRSIKIGLTYCFK